MFLTFCKAKISNARVSAAELYYEGSITIDEDIIQAVGILPGDVAVVRRQPTASSGDVVVALVGDEATVKTLRLRRGRVELHAANPAFMSPYPTTLTRIALKLCGSNQRKEIFRGLIAWRRRLAGSANPSACPPGCSGYSCALRP